MGRARLVEYAEAYRLQKEGKTQREIGAVLGASHQAVSECLRKKPATHYEAKPEVNAPAYVPPRYTYAEMQALAAEVGQVEAQRQMHRRRA